MLVEFAELSERDAQRTTTAIGHLLRHQFLHVDDRGSSSLMETLRRPSLGALIASYFDVAGYRLVVREIEGWAGILPDTERLSPPRMRLEDTLVLLVLRRAWEEAVHNGDIQSRGAVLTTLNTTYDAYQEIVSRGRRSALPVGAFREIVEGLERRAIVWLGPFDDQEQDMELIIRPIVAAVAGDEFLATLELLLQRAELTDDDVDEADEAEDAGEAEDAEREDPEVEP